MERDDRPTGASSARDGANHVAWRGRAALRFAWAMASALMVENVVFGLAVLPAFVFWRWHWGIDVDGDWLRVLILAMAFMPAYLLFAFALMVFSALSMRLLGWRTPDDAVLRISDLDWPLADWARYGISMAVVRMLSGPVFRSTPVWVWYMRLNGARIGRRCWVNSLDVTDHCLLELGDDVVVGAGVHFAGHTVERGCVRTGRVKLGSGTIVGVGTHVGIDVETGPGCQIGSLSVVPKGARLDGHSVYVGSPVRKLRGDSEDGGGGESREPRAAAGEAST